MNYVGQLFLLIRSIYVMLTGIFKDQCLLPVTVFFALVYFERNRNRVTYFYWFQQDTMDPITKLTGYKSDLLNVKPADSA